MQASLKTIWQAATEQTVSVCQGAKHKCTKEETSRVFNIATAPSIIGLIITEVHETNLCQERKM